MGNFVLPTDPMALVVILVVVLLYVIWHFRKRIWAAFKKGFLRSKWEEENRVTASIVAEKKNEPAAAAGQPPENKEPVKSPTQPSTLGTGEVKCLCFRKINGVVVADFTTMPKPIGEMYALDPSCPITGSGHIVYENKDGNILDYDPREVEYKTENSPEMAWFAINWDIVKEVFFVPLQWWKSPALWMAGVMLVIIFITTLAVID